MAAKNKFNIGDTVVATVSVRGGYEPSLCSPGEKMEVNEIKRRGDEYIYVCGYDGYSLKESQLMSVEEYKESL